MASDGQLPFGRPGSEQPLPGFPGQPRPRGERLSASRVLVVGVGALGCPAALQLAVAGVGTIGLMDPDRVELSNLHRQILHTESDLDTRKTESARLKIASLGRRTTVRTFAETLTPGNATAILAEFDFIIDGTDNVTAKFLINDAAVDCGRPYSHAGILGFRGQTMTVLPGRSTCYRCLFEAPPPEDDLPTCQQAGVIGAVAGAIGIVQATEAIKFVLGAGDLLTDRLLTFDALQMHWRSIRLRRNPRCTTCGNRSAALTAGAAYSAT